MRTSIVIAILVALCLVSQISARCSSALLTGASLSGGYLQFSTKSVTGTAITVVQTSSPYQDVRVTVGSDDLVDFVSNITYSFSGDPSCIGNAWFYRNNFYLTYPYALTLGASNQFINYAHNVNVGSSSTNNYEVTLGAYCTSGTYSLTVSSANFRVAYPNGC